MDTFKNLKKVTINTLKMLKERGYNTVPYEKYLTEEKLVHFYHQDNFELIIEPLKECSAYLNTIHVRFSVHCKAKYDDIKTMISDLISIDTDDEEDGEPPDSENDDESQDSGNDEAEHDILLIYSLPVKTTRIKHHRLQILEYRDLLFNKIDHIFVPKHELIRDPQEINAILEQYKITNKYRFPLMTKTDPISKYYNAKKGDMFKITCNGKNGESVIYRCVV